MSFGNVAADVPRGESGGVMMPPVQDELFYFGTCIDKFAIHKAGRVVGLFEHRDQNGRTKKCFRIQYPDGEIAHAEFVEESQGAFEMLNYDSAVAKHGEEAFK
jgi:hypothetical protein